MEPLEKRFHYTTFLFLCDVASTNCFTVGWTADNRIIIVLSALQLGEVYSSSVSLIFTCYFQKLVDSRDLWYKGEPWYDIYKRHNLCRRFENIAVGDKMTNRNMIISRLIK